MTAAKNNRNQQCKKWEKERRDRLKDSFNALAKLLPCYEPSANISKIEILTKSAEYITKLEAKTKESSTLASDEVKELHVRVVHLTTRNEQLANLLRDANITIPTECGRPINDKVKKWSGKITPQKAKEIITEKTQKENKFGPLNKSLKARKQKSTNVPEEKKKKAKRKGKTTESPTVNTSLNLVKSASTLTITNVQPIQPYYIIANNIATTITTQATSVKNVITTPVISTTNQQQNKTFPSGIILPVVQPQTIINPPLFLNTATSNNTVFVVKTNKSDQNVPSTGKRLTISTSTPSLTTNVLKSNNSVTCKQILPKKLALLRPKKRLGNKIQLPSNKFDNFILWPNPSLQVAVKKRRVKSAKRKRKVDNQSKDESNNTKNAKKAKKQKTNDNDVIDLNELDDLEDNAKKQSSDYSIDTICKDNETPTSKDIENVINEVVEKANTTNENEQVKNHDKGANQQLISSNTLNTSLKQNKIVGDASTITKEVQKEQPVIKNVSINSQNAVQSEKAFLKEIKQMTMLTQNICTNAGNTDLQHQPQPQTISNQTQIRNSNGNNANNQILQTQNTFHNLHQSQHLQHSQNSNPIQSESSQQQPQQNTLLHSHQQELHLHSELSNDIFASLQVQGSQNPESTSPTAAFLNAFPLVSSFTGVKVTEVLEEETTDSPHGTPTLLQIGNLEASQKLQNTQNQSQQQNLQSNADPSLINLDNFNFFNNNLYNSFDNMLATSVTTNITTNTVNSVVSSVSKTKAITQCGNSNMVPVNNTHNTSQSNQNTAQINTNNNNAKNYRNNNASSGNNSNNIGKKHVKTSTSIQNVHIDKPFVAQPFYDNTQVANSSRAVVSSGINFNSTSNRVYNEYNTFNPFELPKTTAQQPFIKSYNESSYVNSVNTNCNYTYQTTDYNYQLAKSNYYNGNNCGNNFYNNNTNATNQSSNNNNIPTNNKFTNKKAKDAHTKSSMVNWMAPDFASTSSATAAKVTSYSDMPQNNYLYSNDYQNTMPVAMDHQSLVHQTHQEHQFPWSPTKLHQSLDSAQLFPPSTLPTLVGDLALGIGSYSGGTQVPQVPHTSHVPQVPHVSQPVHNHSQFEKKQKKKQSQSYESGNILSVSQLVDHNKDTNSGATPSTARITNRRSSGNNRVTHKSPVSKSTANKRHKEKEKSKVCEAKNVSNYSAESLIAANKQQNYPKTIPPYLPDNILSYFPHNIDDNFTQNNHQSTYHQNNTFTTNYNNTFIPSSTSTTYLSTTNFMPDMYDNPIENIFSHVNSTKNVANTSYNKKSPPKTKDYSLVVATSVTSSNTTNLGHVPNVSTNIGNIPNISNLSNIGNIGNIASIPPITSTKIKNKKKDTLVDLSFLSMPSINSPLLPEDFHGNLFPPPPNPNQLYPPCKNPMYKQSTELSSILPLSATATSTVMATAPVSVPGIAGDNALRARAIQHPEISPAPGSLTNFNLCTIFPEINRTNTVVPDVFRNYANNSSQKNSNYLPNLE